LLKILEFINCNIDIKTKQNEQNFRFSTARPLKLIATVIAGIEGGWAGIAVAAAVVLSSLAGLNGWSLLMGQVPMPQQRMKGLLIAVLTNQRPEAGGYSRLFLSSASSSQC
jgi:amino acid transporter